MAWRRGMMDSEPSDPDPRAQIRSRLQQTGTDWRPPDPDRAVHIAFAPTLILTIRSPTSAPDLLAWTVISSSHRYRWLGSNGARVLLLPLPTRGSAAASPGRATPASDGPTHTSPIGQPRPTTRIEGPSELRKRIRTSACEVSSSGHGADAVRGGPNATTRNRSKAEVLFCQMMQR